MLKLAPADRAEILILVDNVTDNLSSVPVYVETEMQRLWKRGLKLLSGRCMCCAAHGLACAVTVWRGDTAHTLLFDTGPDDSVFGRNVERLGFDMGGIEMHRPVPRPLGSFGRDAARARDDSTQQRRSSRPNIYAPGHVPQSRNEGCGRLDASVRRCAEPGSA